MPSYYEIFCTNYPKNGNKSCKLAYKICYEKLSTIINGQKRNILEYQNLSK